MIVLAIVLAVAFLLAVGYLAGRIQPYAWLADWTNDQLRFHLDRWASRPRQAVLFALLLATDTRRTLHAWRHRKDPEPERAPAITFRRIGDGPKIPDHRVDEEA